MFAKAQPLLVVLPAWAMFGERPRFTEIAGAAAVVVALAVVAHIGRRASTIALPAADTEPAKPKPPALDRLSSSHFPERNAGHG